MKTQALDFNLLWQTMLKCVLWTIAFRDFRRRIVTKKKNCIADCHK
jgi:hypothetical protein